MRGEQTLLFLDFSETQSIQPLGQISRKGRSSSLLKNRNAKLIARYYFYNAIIRKDLAETIRTLMYEFDIDDRTISLILKNEADAIIDMRKKKPSVDSFKKQWPWLRWSVT